MINEPSCVGTSADAPLSSSSVSSSAAGTQGPNLDALVSRVRATVARYGESAGFYDPSGYNIDDGEGRQLTIGDVRRLCDALAAGGAA